MPRRVIIEERTSPDLQQLLLSSGALDIAEAIDNSRFHVNQPIAITRPEIVAVTLRGKRDKLFLHAEWAFTPQQLQEAVWVSQCPEPRVGDRVRSSFVRKSVKIHAFYPHPSKDGSVFKNMIALFDNDFERSEKVEKRFETEMRRARSHHLGMTYNLSFATIFSRELLP